MPEEFVGPVDEVHLHARSLAHQNSPVSRTDVTKGPGSRGAASLPSVAEGKHDTCAATRSSACGSGGGPMSTCHDRTTPGPRRRLGDGCRSFVRGLFQRDTERLARVHHEQHGSEADPGRRLRRFPRLGDAAVRRRAHRRRQGRSPHVRHVRRNGDLRLVGQDARGGSAVPPPGRRVGVQWQQSHAVHEGIRVYTAAYYQKYRADTWPRTRSCARGAHVYLIGVVDHQEQSSILKESTP